MGEFWKSLFVNLLLCATGKDGHTVLLETEAAPWLNLSFPLFSNDSSGRTAREAPEERRR